MPGKAEEGLALARTRVLELVHLQQILQGRKEAD
jgi:hypothetical protein